MTDSLTDSQRHVLLAISQHRGGVDWNGLVAWLKAKKRLPKDLSADMDALYKGGLLATKGSMTPAQMEAEVQEAIKGLRAAAASGSTFTWRTKQTFVYGLTKTGVDVCRLIMPTG